MGPGLGQQSLASGSIGRAVQRRADQGAQWPPSFRAGDAAGPLCAERRVLEVRPRRGRRPRFVPFHGCVIFPRAQVTCPSLPARHGAVPRPRGLWRTWRVEDSLQSPPSMLSRVFPAVDRLLHASVTTRNQEDARGDAAPEPRPVTSVSVRTPSRSLAPSFGGTSLDAVRCPPATVTPRQRRRGEPEPSAAAA